VAHGEVVGPGGADEAQDAVGPGDLDDEAEVEARPLLERLDPVEEGRVGTRLRGTVEQGGVDLDLLGPAVGGAEAHPLLPRAVLHGERLEARRRLREDGGGISCGSSRRAEWGEE
jgi:hypothetical protein